jgi:hypothetical protein
MRRPSPEVTCAFGHEPAIAYEPIQDGGVRLIRTGYWKPEMRLNDQTAAVDE